MGYFSLKEAARRYDLYRPKVHAKLLEQLPPYLGHLPHNKAIDIACGTGESTKALSKYANNTYGIDCSARCYTMQSKMGYMSIAWIFTPMSSMADGT